MLLMNGKPEPGRMYAVTLMLIHRMSPITSEAPTMSESLLLHETAPIHEPPHHIRVPLWKSPPLPQSPLISDPVRTRSRAPGTPEEPKWHTGWETLTYTTVYGQMFHILTSRLYPLVEHSIQNHGMGYYGNASFVAITSSLHFMMEF